MSGLVPFEKGMYHCQDYERLISSTLERKKVLNSLLLTSSD